MKVRRNPFSCNPFDAIAIARHVMNAALTSTAVGGLFPPANPTPSRPVHSKSKVPVLVRRLKQVFSCAPLAVCTLLSAVVLFPNSMPNTSANSTFLRFPSLGISPGEADLEDGFNSALHVKQF